MASIGVDIVFDGEAVFVPTRTTREHYRAKVINVLLTTPGERPMRPTLGCSLNKYLFEPFNDEQKAKLETVIRTELENQLPELSIDTLILSGNQDGLVKLYLEFGMPPSDQSEAIEIPF